MITLNQEHIESLEKLDNLIESGNYALGDYDEIARQLTADLVGRLRVIKEYEERNNGTTGTI